MALRVETSPTVILTAQTETALPQKTQEEKELDQFRTFSGFILPEERSFSLLDNIQTYLFDFLWKLSFDDPNVFKDWIDNKEAVFEDFEFALRNEFYQFKNSGDPKPLVAFLSKNKPSIEKGKERFIKGWDCDEEKYSRLLDFYSCAIDLIATGKMDLLTQATSKLCPSSVLSAEERFNAAFEAHRMIAGNVFRLCIGIDRLGRNFRQQLSEAGLINLKSKSHNVIFKEPEVFILDPYRHTPDVSESDAYDFSAFFSRISKSYNTMVPRFIDISDRVLMHVAIDRAADIDCDEYHIQIYNTAFEPYEKWDEKLRQEISSTVKENTLSKKVEHVDEFLEDFRVFLPHLKQLHTSLDSICAELANSAAVLKNFPLYCRYGDFKNLREKTSKKKLSPKRFDQIAMQEIAAFSEGLKTNRVLIGKMTLLYKMAALQQCDIVQISDAFSTKSYEKIQEILKTTDYEEVEKIISEINRKTFERFVEEVQELKRYRAFYSIIEGYKKKIMRLNHCLLCDPVRSAEKCMGDLFIKELRQPKSEKVEKVKKVKSPTKSGKKKAPSPQKKDKPKENQSIIKQSLPEQAASPAPFPHSPTEKVEEAKSMVKSAFKVFNTDCRGFGSKAALTNAEVNYAALLGVMGRLLRHADRPFSRQEVLSLVVDSVRYGSLGLEQLLVALDCECNRISSAEELESRLSHDLDYLLEYCHFDLGLEIPEGMSQWIHEARKAACWAGNIGECELGKGHVQSLLAKTKFFVEGSDAYSGDQLIHECLAFINKVGNFGGYFLWNIEVAKEYPWPTNNAVATGFQKAFSSYYQILSAREFAIQKDPHPFANQLKDFNEKLETFAKLKSQQSFLSNEFYDSLNTVQNILLPHLSLELSTQKGLNDFESSLHLRNVLLLDQMVAEELTRMVLSVCNPFSYYGRDEHDLSTLIKELKMSSKVTFSADEWEFINRGRNIRQIVRYPVDPLQKNRNQKMPLHFVLQNSHETAQKGKIGYYEKEDEEFTTVGKRSTDPFVQIAKSDAQTMTQVMLKILNFASI